MRIFILVVLWGLFVPLTYGQQQTDSLLALYNNAAEFRNHEVSMLIAKSYANANPVKCIDWINTALTYSYTDMEEVKARQVLGSAYFRTGQIQKSIECFNRIVQLGNELGFEAEKAQAQSALGNTYFISGKLSASADNYLQALRYFEATQDKNSMVSVFYGLANIYNKQNNFGKALEYNLKAIHIYEASSNKFKTLIGYDQIGNLYQKQGNYIKANEYYLRSLKLYVEFNNLAGQASTLHQIGNNNQLAGRFQDAIVNYTQSLKLSKQLNMLPLQAASYNGLATTYEKLRLYEKGIYAANEAQKIAQQATLKIELEQAYETLSRLYRVIEKKDEATTFSNLSREIKDSLYNDSTLKKLADLQLLFDGEKKQRKIELQQKEQQLLELELLREKEIRKSFIIGLVLVGLSALVFLWLFVVNKRFAGKLKQQKLKLEQTTNEIIKQKEELGQLNNVKDRFFSIISHDLRNNLTTMKLYFDLISNPDYTPSTELNELTKQISFSVDNTIDLLENLLVWAKSQINSIEPQPQKLNLHQLIRANVDLLRGNALQKSIKLINNIDSETAVWADEDMINLVVRNLISNAIKFTPNNGSVTISNRLLNEHNVAIQVADTGVGINKQNLEKLFTKTQNPTTLGTANEKGTGLGLLLCKEFVEKNKGSIDVQSEPDEGSTFTVVLPTA